MKGELVAESNGSKLQILNIGPQFLYFELLTLKNTLKPWYVALKVMK